MDRSRTIDHLLIRFANAIMEVSAEQALTHATIVVSQGIEL